MTIQRMGSVCLVEKRLLETIPDINATMVGNKVYGMYPVRLSLLFRERPDAANCVVRTTPPMRCVLCVASTIQLTARTSAVMVGEVRGLRMAPANKTRTAR